MSSKIAVFETVFEIFGNLSISSADDTGSCQRQTKLCALILLINYQGSTSSNDWYNCGDMEKPGFEYLQQSIENDAAGANVFEGFESRHLLKKAKNNILIIVK